MQPGRQAGAFGTGVGGLRGHRSVRRRCFGPDCRARRVELYEITDIFLNSDESQGAGVL